jgi:hypothetical protein
VLGAFNVPPADKIRIDAERISIKITVVNNIRIPIQGRDCAIIQNFQTSGKEARARG